jgi:CRP-like cAMP-binding protein
VNGAVEEAIVRARRRIAVGLAGPGRAFSYLGLLDGGGCALSATARERSLLLIIPADVFDSCLRGFGPASRPTCEGVARDLMTAVRRADVGFVRAMPGGRALSSGHKAV